MLSGLLGVCQRYGQQVAGPNIMLVTSSGTSSKMKRVRDDDSQVQNEHRNDINIKADVWCGVSPHCGADLDARHTGRRSETGVHMSCKCDWVRGSLRMILFI